MHNPTSSRRPSRENQPPSLTHTQNPGGPPKVPIGPFIDDDKPTATAMEVVIPSRSATSTPDGNPFMTLVDAAASLLQDSNKAPQDSKEEEEQQQSTSDNTGLKAAAVKTVEVLTAGDPSVLQATEAPLSKPQPPTNQQPPKKVTFPEELMEVLEDEQHRDVLAWMPDGLAFTIVNHKRFVTAKMQALFKIRNMSSFVRKLSRWGFQRVHDVTTNNSDVFRHPHFHRGKNDVLVNIKCVPQPPLQKQSTAASPKTTPTAANLLAASRTTPSAATSKTAQRATPAVAASAARKAAKNGMKNLVSQSHALKKALKNRRSALVMMTPTKANGNGAAGGGAMYLTTTTAARVPVTPCTPQQGVPHEGSAHVFPVTTTTTTTTTMPTTTRRDARLMTDMEHRYMHQHQQQLHQPYLQQQASASAAAPSAYSTYVTEPSCMQTHHMSAGGSSSSASSVHERLLSVAEDPRLPAALRRRLVSVALDSLRDQLDEESQRSVISFGPSTSSSSNYNLDTSLGRSMSSLSSSTRSSSSSTSISVSQHGSSASYPVMVMRPGGGPGGRATTSMHHPSYAHNAYDPSASRPSPPPYLPMSVAGHHHHHAPHLPQAPPGGGAYRHVMRRSDDAATEVAGGTGGYPMLYR
jgi:HSF-type DNA-binding